MGFKYTESLVKLKLRLFFFMKKLICVRIDRTYFNTD